MAPPTVLGFGKNSSRMSILIFSFAMFCGAKRASYKARSGRFGVQLAERPQSACTVVFPALAHAG